MYPGGGGGPYCGGPCCGWQVKAEGAGCPIGKAHCLGLDATLKHKFSLLTCTNCIYWNELEESILSRGTGQGWQVGFGEAVLSQR